MTPEEALKKAIKAAGGAAELARKFNITVQAVSGWKVAPPTRAVAIEEATGGEVTKEELCPNVFAPKVSAA